MLCYEIKLYISLALAFKRNKDTLDSCHIILVSFKEKKSNVKAPDSLQWNLS